METPARLEGQAEETYASESRRLAEAREQLERAVAKCEVLGRRERREQFPAALSREQSWREAVDRRTAALEQIEPPGTEARRERELAEQLLDQRAARPSPPLESSRPPT